MTYLEGTDSRIKALEEMGKREYRLILTNPTLYAGWRDQICWLRIEKEILEGTYDY